MRDCIDEKWAKKGGSKMTFTIYSIVILAFALMAVEGASTTKMITARLWTDYPPIAVIASVALIALLISSIVAMASTRVPEQLRNKVKTAISVLLSFQALSNVLISYQFSLIEMDGIAFSKFFFNMISSENAQRLFSLIAGGILSITAVIFWQVLAVQVQRLLEEKEERKHRIAQLSRLYKKGDVTEDRVGASHNSHE